MPVAYSPLGSQAELSLDPDREMLLDSKELKAIAEKKGVSLGQLCISWGVKRGYVVIPKSAKSARIKSNLELVDLTEEELEAVNKVGEGRNERFVDNLERFGYDIWKD